MSKSKKIQLVEIRSLIEPHITTVSRITQECGLGYWSISDYTNETDRKDSISLVAVFDKQVVGFIIMRLVGSEEAEIYNIGVSKNSRKAGYGSLLLKTAIERALEDSELKTIWLEVRESNITALEFYKKHGFQNVGCRKNFYAQPVENAVLMKLELSRT